MGIGNILGRVSRPSGKTLEAPIRAVVHEVLREQGYASPAEVQALRDEARQLKARLDKIEGRLDELVKLLDASRADVAAARADAAATKASVPAADDRVPALQAEVARLAAALERPLVPAPQAPSATVSAVSAIADADLVAAAARGTCKVDGCEQGVRSKGFCSAHYQQWRRGTLKGFVGLDGLAEIDGRIVHLTPDHAGGIVTMDAHRLMVDGRLVTETPAG